MKSRKKCYVFVNTQVASNIYSATIINYLFFRSTYLLRSNPSWYIFQYVGTYLINCIYIDTKDECVTGMND